MIEDFKGSSQYGDWSGSIETDNLDNSSDEKGLYVFFEKNKLKHDNEMLVGLKYYQQDLAPSCPHISVKFYFANITSLDEYNEKESNETLEIRTEDVKVDIQTFISFFKRFSFSLSLAGSLEGKEIDTVDSKIITK